MPCQRHDIRDEHGFTLIEALVTLALSLLVFGGLVGLIASGFRTQGSQYERSVTLDRDREAFDRLMRELRQAVSVTTPASAPASSSRIAFQRRVNGVLQTIRVDCGIPRDSAYSCTRQVTAPTAGTAARFLEGVTNTDVFTTTAGDTARGTTVAIELRISVPEASHPLVLRGTASPRNCQSFADGPLGGGPCDA